MCLASHQTHVLICNKTKFLLKTKPEKKNKFTIPNQTNTMCWIESDPNCFHFTQTEAIENVARI